MNGTRTAAGNAWPRAGWVAGILSAGAIAWLASPDRRPAASTGVQADRSFDDVSQTSDHSDQVIDDPLRTFVETSVPPEYPASARAAGTTGVAVAQVELDEHRVVRRVDVLEAPSQDIARAVRDAIGRWRFRSSPEPSTKTSTAGRWLSGKLTFYFQRGPNGYEVASPRQAHVLGPTGDQKACQACGESRNPSVNPR
jgi:hypothetical protein